jgi:hypothetical protein
MQLTSGAAEVRVGPVPAAEAQLEIPLLRGMLYRRQVYFIEMYIIYGL